MMIYSDGLLARATIALGLLLGGGVWADSVVQGGTQSVNLVPEAVLREFPEPYRLFLVWDGVGDCGAGKVDPEDFTRATENTAAWIRAVVRQEHVPGELDEHIVGVVDSIDGYDATRAAFASDEFRFLVTQDSARIVVVASPVDERREGTRSSQQEVELYLKETLELLFKHAKAIQFLSQLEETSFGLKMTRDENLYDEGGRALSYEERKRISRLPQPEQSEVLRNLIHRHEARLREIDPTIPDEFIGGARNYWWGRGYAATDGHVVIFSAPKSNGGPLVVADWKDWFRKDKLPRPAPKNPRKRYGPGSLWPPKDADCADEE